MTWKFNPFTGTLDQVGGDSTVVPEPILYAQFARAISINVDSSLRIDNNGGARVFFSDLSEGFDVQGSVTVQAGSSLKINTNGKGTILGV